MKFKIIEVTLSGGASPNSGTLTPKSDQGNIDKMPMGKKRQIKRRIKPKVKKKL